MWTTNGQSRSPGPRHRKRAIRCRQVIELASIVRPSWNDECPPSNHNAVADADERASRYIDGRRNYFTPVEVDDCDELRGSRSGHWSTTRTLGVCFAHHAR